MIILYNQKMFEYILFTKMFAVLFMLNGMYVHIENFVVISLYFTLGKNINKMFFFLYF